ncbi:DUF2848 family protein [Natrinema gelatinilyticum]|uniref:DUF2848 family protein n=1 Tax=Natrinema gelatinilyticum TaxID=2961571 RepID=UPI0020C46011|nr:DUF2848 family protein [Natrinema gelatinilyticum]
MTTLDLQLQRQGVSSSETVSVTVDRIANCGWTGRNEEELRKHIEELEEEGIEAPDEFPVIYPKPYHLITTSDDIEVLSAETSGEAEFVLFPQEKTDEVYVGVGSDHTDREMETESIVVAKGLCPNVVGENLWVLDDIIDHWDQIELRSWTGSDGERVLYQDATLEAILSPADLFDLVEEKTTEPTKHTAVFSGSVGTETGDLIHGDFFEVELHDPVLDRTMRAEYDVSRLGWVVDD